MNVIILVGGKGTRLQSVVRDVPKPMAPIQGRPFLELLLKQLAEFGDIDRVILATGYKSKFIDEWIQAVKKLYPFEIVQSLEVEPLGTGGAVVQALDFVSGDECLVMNGDSFLEFDFASFLKTHRQCGGAITVALTCVSDTGRYGEADFDPTTMRIQGFREKSSETKPGLINGGVYLIRNQFLSPFKKGGACSFERDVIPHMMTIGMFGHVQKGRFIDIGTEESYLLAQRFFSCFTETKTYESAS